VTFWSANPVSGVCGHKSTTCYSVSAGLALRLARVLPWWAGLASTKVRIFVDVGKQIFLNSVFLNFLFTELLKLLFSVFHKN